MEDWPGTGRKKNSPKIRGTGEISFPTGLFIISESQDEEIGKDYVVQERRSTDFEASKLWKGRSGLLTT